VSLTGVVPAITTPFHADLEVDLDALRQNLRRLIAAGASGVVTAGTMGEASALSPNEREEIIAALVAEANADCEIWAGVSASLASDARVYADAARAAGAVGVMCLPPLTYDADLRELVAFFEEVCGAGLPVMIYNNPGASLSDLAAGTIVELARQVPGITSVKECSGDARRIAEILERADGELDVFVGGDDWALEGFAAGATGWVSGCSNVAPAECVLLYELSVEGRLVEARALYERLLPLARLDMHPKLVQFYKAGLDRVGANGGPVRPPRLALREDERVTLDEAMTALELEGVRETRSS
jgi:dihydrodipicolinate synthase/N-acetylneuraminate lyase